MYAIRSYYDTSDDTTLFINALSGVSGTVREALVTMPGSATTLVNTARATGGSSGYGSYGAPQLTASDSATVTVKPAANNAPVASDDRISTRQDTPVTLNVLANDSDVDNNLDTDQVTLKQNPAHGTAVNEGSGNVTYTPNSSFQGSDSFV